MNATTSYNSLLDRAIGKLDQSGGRRRRKTKQKTKQKDTKDTFASQVNTSKKKTYLENGKIITPKSAPSAPANICLFDTPPSQVAFNKGQWMTYTPTNPVDSGTSYSFHIFDSAHFFQLNKTYLTFKLRLKNLEVATGDANIVKLTNFIGATFFSQVKLLFNNVLVYDSNYYDYKSYIHTLFGENGDTKNGFLTAAGWTDPGDTGKDRVITESRPYEICAPLFLEPFQTERLLVPHINIQLDLYRNSDEFCLEASKATKARLEMYDLKLHMRAIDVVSSAAIALESRLRTTPAQYPFTVSKVKIIAIPAGRLELPFTTLYHDIIPRRVIVGILSPETSSTTDQFNFEHANLSEIQLDAAGTMYPPQPIQCDFSNKHYTQAFVRMYEELGCVSNRSCPKISYDQFRSGCAFFVFNLTPLDSSNSWELQKSGSTQIRMRFSSKTKTEGYNAIVLSQFDAAFEIDGFRNVNIQGYH
ncbi:hypothetical protein CAEBREN_15872 [Caenorhabditis brenneri]|uniref:PAZ domain-containing protein n=1 Tax=Caenorhabditis brenneri TaxID=135651 RepID=G0MAL1_CAEBE|nr:hypothetical protein CAEBREN_15872 [Caenorhabditis brenneri]